MSTTEDQIAQSVSELSQSAWRATHSKEVVAWLCELAQAAASAPCGRTMAREQSLGLTQVLGASHCGTAFRNGDRLLGELRNMAGEVVGPVTVSLADESSPIVEAYNGDSVNIAGDIGLMRGLKSTAAVRLGAKSNALSVALLAQHQPRTWHDEDLALIEAFAQHVRAVHDRETKRNELQRQSALLETLQESMEAGVILLSPDGRITEVNAAAAAIAGFEATELIGRSLWSALLVAEDLRQVKQ